MFAVAECVRRLLAFVCTALKFPFKKEVLKSGTNRLLVSVHQIQIRWDASGGNQEEPQQCWKHEQKNAKKPGNMHTFRVGLAWILHAKPFACASCSTCWYSQAQILHTAARI